MKHHSYQHPSTLGRHKKDLADEHNHGVSALNLTPAVATWVDTDPSKQPFALKIGMINNFELAIDSIWGRTSTSHLYAANIRSTSLAGFIAQYTTKDAAVTLQCNLKLGVAVVGVFKTRHPPDHLPGAFTRRFLVPSKAPQTPIAMGSPLFLHGSTDASIEQRLCGRWRNTRADGHDIERIVIRTEGSQTRAQIWSNGPQGLLDWGAAELQLYHCIEEDGVPSLSALAYYHVDEMDCVIQIRQNKGILAVTTFSRFTNRSQCNDYTKRELFYRR